MIFQSMWMEHCSLILSVMSTTMALVVLWKDGSQIQEHSISFGMLKGLSDAHSGSYQQQIKVLQLQ